MMPDFIPLEEFMGGAAQAQGGLVPLEEFGGTVAQENPANYAMRVFQAKGWSREQAAGMVGNLLHESNLHPEAVGDGGASFGIAQWNGARRKGLEVFAAARGAAVNDFNTQLDYVHHELENTEVAAGQALKNTGDVDSAVNIFSEKYERPGVPRLESRLAHARRTYDPEKYKYGDFLDVAGAADVGPGLYQGKPPRREPGIYAEDRSLLA